MDKGESAVLSIFMKDYQTTWVSTPSVGIKGKQVCQRSYHMMMTGFLYNKGKLKQIHKHKHKETIAY